MNEQEFHFASSDPSYKSFIILRVKYAKKSNKFNSEQAYKATITIPKETPTNVKHKKTILPITTQTKLNKNNIRSLISNLQSNVYKLIQRYSAARVPKLKNTSEISQIQICMPT